MTRIYLATGKGLQIVDHVDGQWRGEVRLQGENVQCVATSVMGSGVYCGTYQNGIFRSSNAGFNWQPGGLSGKRVTSVAVVRAIGSSGVDVVFAGTEPSAVFKSVDAGQNWVELPDFLHLPSSGEWKFPPRPETHHVRQILPDPHDDNRLFAAIEAGALLRSEDTGKTWRDRVAGAPLDTHTLLTHPVVPDRLYSAAGDGYFESLDAGDTWEKIEDGLAHRYCWSVAVSGADPDTRMLSVAADARGAHWQQAAHSFVYRRLKGGAWHELRTGLPDPKGRRAALIAASVKEPGLFYLTSEGELYRSVEQGDSWQQLAIKGSPGYSPVHALAMAVVEPM